MAVKLYRNWKKANAFKMDNTIGLRMSSKDQDRCHIPSALSRGGFRALLVDHVIDTVFT